MKRRDVLKGLAATAVLPPWLIGSQIFADPGGSDSSAETRIFTSPAEAIKSPREQLAYVVALYVGTKVKAPDYLATIDLDPASKTYSQVIHRLPMPNVGDELHHFGWNACGSCHGDAGPAVIW